MTYTLRDRVLGCWVGKAVGGTLGQTFEGLEGPLEADFYTPVPTEMVPNDDLDLQVVFAAVLSGMDEPRVDRHLLAEAWRKHVGFPWNEYGVALRNLAEGIHPPHTGSFDNWFTCGEGAAIRSELWACLAPGDPDRAAAYAYEDACFDHAGDGIVAAQFLARLESYAFVESDCDRLLDVALEGVPLGSGIRDVVQDTRAWVAEGLHWTEVRSRIMAKYGRSDFTDVRPNTGFVILGWLAGRDFSERILICNNCGEDTDSSTASLGALLGILDPGSIDARWVEPIGHDLVLNDDIYDVDAPPTIEGFTDLVLALRDRLPSERPSTAESEFDPAAFSIPVRIGWMNTLSGRWDIRDQTELPPVGTVPDLSAVEFVDGSLPGTWFSWERSAFEDRILLVRLTLDAGDAETIQLMVHSSEHFRVWLDGEYLFGGQGTQYAFPAPHMAPAGQFTDVGIGQGAHDLVVAVKRPPSTRSRAEIVLAATTVPDAQWIPHAFRPGHRPAPADALGSSRGIVEVAEGGR